MNLDRQCLWKQCRSRSDGFFRSHLIRVYTVFHSVYKFIWTNNMESPDWLTVRNGDGKLNLFSRIRVKNFVVWISYSSVFTCSLFRVSSMISHQQAYIMTTWVKSNFFWKNGVCRELIFFSYCISVQKHRF